jgi:6-phosphogluconate dehydrogenase
MPTANQAATAHIGVVGLSVMGSNLALPSAPVAEFTASLERPRRILVMV